MKGIHANAETLFYAHKYLTQLYENFNSLLKFDKGSVN